jgi:hypothetical protein
MSSENNSDRNYADSAKLHQQPPSTQAIGKKSKIIYSINKSSHNKINSMQRSKNNVPTVNTANAAALDIIINSGTA